MSANEQPLSASAKDELQQLLGLLSEYECSHLLRTMRDVAAGERFWEDDAAIFYNEYVKARWFNASRDPSSMMPVIPATEEGIFAPVPLVKTYDGAPRIPLPPPQQLTASLSELLLRRRSRRQYTGQPLSLVQLATLLDHGAGVTGAEAGYGYSHVPLRTFPSSGGLQSPEVYLFAEAVGGMPPGLYHYQGRDRALELLKPGQHRYAVQRLVSGQPYVDTAAVVFAITGVYARLRWKYGARAYRYMCMDAGFLGENLHLAAEALGLGCCAIAGFIDDALEEVLGIDGKDETALMLVSVGVV